jgi:DNA-directed RNA polymerase subunit RPC12/RpoP
MGIFSDNKTLQQNTGKKISDCPYCGTPVYVNQPHEFCMNCGKPLPPHVISLILDARDPKRLEIKKLFLLLLRQSKDTGF